MSPPPHTWRDAEEEEEDEDGDEEEEGIIPGSARPLYVLPGGGSVLGVRVGFPPPPPLLHPARKRGGIRKKRSSGPAG